MGQTREKKVSKRALKGTAEIHGNGKASVTPETALPGASHAVPPEKHLAIPQPSRKGRSSLRSSASSRESSTTPLTYECRVEVREADGKGSCLFATQSIPRGALVLAEIPAIRLTGEEEAQTDRAEEIVSEKFGLLSKADKKAFRKLHDSEKEGFSRTRSIYHTNCYNLAGHRSELGGSCVGLRASRINHSCIPNVQFSFLGQVPAEINSVLEEEAGSAELGDRSELDSNRGVMLFHAIKRIGKGQEIVSNYESAYLLTRQRQVKMRMYYGFTCDCKACNPGDNSFWLKSDDRRLQMIKLREAVRDAERSWQQQHEQSSGWIQGQLEEESFAGSDYNTHIDTAIEALTKLSDLLELEGLCGIELFHVCRKLSIWTKRGGTAYSEAHEQWQRKHEAVGHTISGLFMNVDSP